MIVYVAIGILLVVFLMYGARWYANANPATLVQVLKWSAVGLVGVAGGYLAFTGRIGWALFAAPMLVPLFRRARDAFRRGGGFGGAASGDPFEGIGSPGQTSEVRTRYVRVVLDHDSGEMNGDVLAGRFEGRALRNLALAELLILLGEARDDEDSVQVLTAYLDRYHGDLWREQASGTEHGQGGAPKNGTMSREEAYEILGLTPGADAAAIKAAHHRLMSKIHPDLGGSTYLAAKINQAKDVLLGA
ncbi:MAG: hypothetical protein K0Q70_2105 [Rhodospirillales bacterium]|jgi:hypothetical protein|nr:hypothetical protein [Rhodospirillales bacterium]